MKKPKQKLVITKKLKGDDGHKTFSVRIKDETVERLDDLAKRTNRSRNDLVNMLLDYAMENCETEEDE
ncbi:MAG: ribbon-helix-helix protein, CopG family [Clostridia bacterium]|nr:ribbon-helix-helix protein, CopG family [Clostridia bacterium]